jgi:hypothetical protein
VEEILTLLSLLMPAFSLPKPPRLASAAASMDMGTLSYRSTTRMKPAASVACLSPVELSAPEH